MVSRFVRKVRTASGAVAVQIVTRRGRQVERVEHVGSAHSDAELALLLSSARGRLSPGQDGLDLGEVPTVAPRMDEVADWTSERRSSAGQPVLDDALGGSPAPRRGRRSAVTAAGRVVATSSLVLWQALADGYSHLGFDVLGDEAFRAMVLARIIEPTSKADSMRVLAEIGAPCPSVRTLFRSLKRCRERDYRDTLAKACTARSAAAGGLSALVMYDCTTLHFEIGDEDALRKVGMSKEHRAMGSGKHQRARRVVYQWSFKRSKRDNKAINAQIARAEKIAAGKAPLARTRFLKVTGARTELDQATIDRARQLTGLKGYVTNIEPAVMDGAAMIAAYHELWQVEASFRMTKSDLRARPIFHHERESIEAHLTVVFAALAVSRHLQNRTGLSIKKLVQTLRTARSATIEINGQHMTLAPELTSSARTILDRLETGH